MRFTNQLSEQRINHRFRVYELETDETELIEEIANLVRELYVDVEDLRSDMTEALHGLDNVADVTSLTELIDEVIEAAVPSPDAYPDQPPQLGLARNELAEVLAYEVATEIHAAAVPAKRVREKEVPSQPARGLDLLSIIDHESGHVCWSQR